MKILAFDSSGLVASVACVEDGSLIAEYTINHKKTHSETLLPMLDEIVSMAEISLDTIDAIAVAAGPGSFTGLRIGAATVKGLALALDKPVVSVPTLEALAYNVWGTDRLVCPIMDAKRGQAYTAIYRFTDGRITEVLDGQPLDISELLDMINEKNEAVIFVGDGIVPFADDIADRLEVPYMLAPAHMNRQRAGAVAYAGYVRYLAGKAELGDDFAPVYMRQSQAERVRTEQMERIKHE